MFRFFTMSDTELLISELFFSHYFYFTVQLQFSYFSGTWRGAVRVVFVKARAAGDAAVGKASGVIWIQILAEAEVFQAHAVG